MKKVIQFMRKNILVKTILICASFVFPILCYLYIGGNKVNAFNYVWVAFYSSLLSCLAFETRAVKIFVCSLNGIFVICMTLFFLMGGAGIIPGVIWNAIVPFLPNPWY